MYLAELLLLDHELFLVEGETGSGSTDPTESGSNSDPDPQPCQKAREKAALYLAELLLLDHELDLLEGEAVLLQPEVQTPIFGHQNHWSGLDPDPEPDPQPCQKARKKLLFTLLSSFFPTMSWICWKEKVSSCSRKFKSPSQKT